MSSSIDHKQHSEDINEFFVTIAVLVVGSSILLLVYDPRKFALEVFALIYYGTLLILIPGIFFLVMFYIAKILKLKNYLRASVAICSSLFIGGIWFHSYTVEHRHYKVLMPSNYKLRLHKDLYTVWFYPGWQRQDQDEFHPREVSKEMHATTPAFFVEGPDGHNIPLLPFDNNSGTSCMMYKSRVAQFEIHKTGDYTIKSILKESPDRTFVIAVVPSAAHNPECHIYGPPFSGAEDTSNLIVNEVQRPKQSAR